MNKELSLDVKPFKKKKMAKPSESLRVKKKTILIKKKMD